MNGISIVNSYAVSRSDVSLIMQLTGVVCLPSVRLITEHCCGLNNSE